MSSSTHRVVFASGLIVPGGAFAYSTVWAATEEALVCSTRLWIRSGSCSTIGSIGRRIASGPRRCPHDASRRFYV